MADNTNILASGVRNVDHINVFDKMAADRFANLNIEAVLIYLIDLVDADALPSLGLQFDVMGYKGWLLASTEAEKRDLIKKAIELHRRKGTPWAVKEAIKRFGFPDVVVEERLTDLVNLYDGTTSYDGTTVYGGDYHWAYFRVLIDINGTLTDITTVQIDTIIALINEYKNVRSWLHTLVLSLDFTDTVEPEEEFAADVLTDLVDGVATQYFYNGALSYNGSNQYDFDILNITIINVNNNAFDYTFDFDFQ